MGTAFLHGRSGGAPLNFKLRAFSSKAEMEGYRLKENTIGVITSTAISEWAFSPTEPEAPTPGFVWLVTGNDSFIKLNALKKNSFYVYPLYAKQYINGAWVDVPTYTYQNGSLSKWWEGEIYDNGNQFEAVTGGLISLIGGGNGKGSITFGDSSISFATKSSYESGTVYTNNLMDLTRFSKMVVELNVTGVNTAISTTVSIGIASVNTNTRGSDVAIVKTNSKATGAYTLECDISTVDSGYPYVCADEANFETTKIYLE